jgi:hypothetical protein
MDAGKGEQECCSAYVAGVQKEAVQALRCGLGTVIPYKISVCRVAPLNPEYDQIAYAVKGGDASTYSASMQCRLRHYTLKKTGRGGRLDLLTRTGLPTSWSAYFLSSSTSMLAVLTWI